MSLGPQKAAQDVVSWEKPAKHHFYCPGNAGNAIFLSIGCFPTTEIYAKLEKQFSQGGAR